MMLSLDRILTGMFVKRSPQLLFSQDVPMFMRHLPENRSIRRCARLICMFVGVCLAGYVVEASEESAGNSEDVSSEDRDFWAFRRLSRPPVPEVAGRVQPRRPIDAFILNRLEQHGLSLSPDAPPTRLVRRAYFDLIGLPPSPDELDAYLLDTRPHAFEELVDRLLASPHYGERWGRHWLDIVGYTDLTSYDGDTTGIFGFIEDRWRYRDYVIDALNSDKPYDRFLAEQLAGDELVQWRKADQYTPEIVGTLAATGFWRNAEDRSESAKELEYKWAFLHNTMQTFGTSVLGLTLRCARCHDHKHEPIPQSDYYRLLSLVTPAFNVEDWKNPKERAIPAISASEKAEIDTENTAIQKRIAEVEAKVKSAKEASKPNNAQIAELQGNVAELKRSLKTHGWIHAVYDVGPAPATHLLERGEFKTPGEEVQPGFVTVLSNGTTFEDLVRPVPGSSGRRAALARWLTTRNSPASALVARVVVNRVWQHLMGVGIVSTSENLGRSGAEPTHPELLDWLAVEFVENGWRIKPLIKTIMTSTVYRQASRREAETQPGTDSQAVDPGNRLLWRARLRRLESEAIRDAMLVASGRFNAAIGGRPVPLKYRRDGVASFDEEKLSTPDEKWRRSIYLFQRRVYHLTVLGVFDQPTIAGSVCRRNASAVALQSLSMMNDDLVLEQAEHFANRVWRQAGQSSAARIELAFRIALSRPPDAQEIAWSSELLNQQARRYETSGASPDEAGRKSLLHLCRVLFNSSEFLYVE